MSETDIKIARNLMIISYATSTPALIVWGVILTKIIRNRAWLKTLLVITILMAIYQISSIAGF